MPQPRRTPCFCLFLLLLSSVTSCAREPARRGLGDSLANVQPAALPTPAAPPATPTDSSPPTLALAPPPAELVEQPLAGQSSGVPDLLVIESHQSKATLAAYLKTTVAMLDWFNAGLPQSVAAGTLVTVPNLYRTVQGETLADIARNTGLPVTLLITLNPTVEPEQILTEGAAIAMPKLYMTPEATTLRATAILLQVDAAALFAANPAWSPATILPANTVIVVPPN